MTKMIKRLIIFFLFIYILLSGSMVCFAGTVSTDINGIDDTLYPGVKAKIQALQTQYPNWIFKVEYTDLEWNEVINGEHQGHGAGNSARNLVPANNASYAGLWICEICGEVYYDTGKWYCASIEALEYMIDVRNSVNKTDVFQFLELSSTEDYSNNETVKAKLREMAATTDYLDEDCINAIINAANTYDVNPYYLMAKIIQEQGYTTKTLIAGNGYKGQYVGVYNFFNFGASGNTEESVILAGLAYASSQGWTSKAISIEKGAALIAKNYIAKGQDTLYYQKFNVIGPNNLYQHQYQQNILGAQSEGTKLRKIYLQIDPDLSGNYVFTVPLYKNMPASACPRPSTTEKHKETTELLMGDVNQDNTVNIIDAVALINYLNGQNEVSEKGILASKVTGRNDVSIVDAVCLINYLNGDAVFAVNSIKTGTLIQNTNVTLSKSPNGGIIYQASKDASIKILSLGDTLVNNNYWDLIVTSKGYYGYIPRGSWK